MFSRRNSAKITVESFVLATNGREMHWVINTHVEAIKIGRQIAERALDSHRKTEESGRFLRNIDELFFFFIIFVI